MWLRLGVLLALDGLADVLGEDLVEDVVCGDGEGGLPLQQPLDQQRVEVAGVHDVVLALVRRAAEEEAEQLERLQPDRLALRAQHLEDGPHAALRQQSTNLNLKRLVDLHI